jgi:hypothetical protein
MGVADGYLLEDLPANELDTIVLGQDAGVDHAFVVVDRKEMMHSGSQHDA